MNNNSPSHKGKRMPEVKHSPLPWSVAHAVEIRSNGFTVGYFRNAYNEPINSFNADFVCMAVNSHEALVKALQAQLDEELPEHERKIIARQALALAGVKA